MEKIHPLYFYWPSSSYKKILDVIMKCHMISQTYCVTGMYQHFYEHDWFRNPLDAWCQAYTLNSMTVAAFFEFNKLREVSYVWQNNETSRPECMCVNGLFLILDIALYNTKISNLPFYTRWMLSPLGTTIDVYKAFKNNCTFGYGSKCIWVTFMGQKKNAFGFQALFTCLRFFKT